jgi:Na+/proline symporter
MLELSPNLIVSIILCYFFLLIIISFFTSRNVSSEDFYVAGRKSPWFVVAFGMIGSSLSGVTFISIPGVVGATPEFMEQLTGQATVRQNIQFSYMQIVFGYFLGYAVIALVLLPIYYRLKLTSIYSYLEDRLGVSSYKTGAAFFIISRTIGAAFRLFLVALVMQRFVMDAYGIPFWATVAISILLIWIYTFRGGIKTIVWTDTLQTSFMLVAVVFTIIYIGKAMNQNIGQLITSVVESEYSKMFFFEKGWEDPNNFFKQFISGALITIVMTGLDQDMMQKNLTCRNLRDAQKNMFTFSSVLIVVNLLFLTLGAMLYLYATNINFEPMLRTDELYPTLALQHLPAFVGILFVLGLIAAAYSSIDSALAALTTSFCVDFLNLEKRTQPETTKKRTRFFVHIGFSILMFIVIIIFNAINNDSVINKLFQIAGYTYGPLLGLFSFGMFTKWYLRNALVPVVCIAAPVITYVLDIWLASQNVNIGFLTLALNGILTFVGLWLIAKKEK